MFICVTSPATSIYYSTSSITSSYLDMSPYLPRQHCHIITSMTSTCWRWCSTFNKGRGKLGKSRKLYAHAELYSMHTVHTSNLMQELAHTLGISNRRPRNVWQFLARWQSKRSTQTTYWDALSTHELCTHQRELKLMRWPCSCAQHASACSALILIFGMLHTCM